MRSILIVLAVFMASIPVNTASAQVAPIPGISDSNPPVRSVNRRLDAGWTEYQGDSWHSAGLDAIEGTYMSSGVVTITLTVGETFWDANTGTMTQKYIICPVEKDAWVAARLNAHLHATLDSNDPNCQNYGYTGVVVVDGNWSSPDRVEHTVQVDDVSYLTTGEKTKHHCTGDYSYNFLVGGFSINGYYYPVAGGYAADSNEQCVDQ